MPRATSQRSLRFEVLEDRRLLAINLFYGGTHNPVNLFDLDGSADNVSLTQPNAQTLKIDLNGVSFGPLSDPAATGLTYEVPGQPTRSTWATVDLTAAGAVPNLSLNTGDGDDWVQLVALSSPNLVNLQIAGQGGYDTVTLYGEPNIAGYLDIDAESIIRFAADHPPTDLALSNSVVYAQSGSGTPVGNFTTTDPDLNDSFSYTLVSGVGDQDNAGFMVTGNQLQTSATFASLAKSQCTARIRTTDAAGLSFEKALTLSVVANPWQNPVNPLDVNGQSGVTPLDVLIDVNYINAHPSGPLPLPHPAPGNPPYYDVSGDGYATAVDVLLIVNYLNRTSTASGGAAEGEAAGFAANRMGLASPQVCALDGTPVAPVQTVTVADTSQSQDQPQRLPQTSPQESLETRSPLPATALESAAWKEVLEDLAKDQRAWKP